MGPIDTEGIVRRVSIAEIMRETGLSRATIDRVLNDRGKVHRRTREVVEETMRRLSASGRSPGAQPAGADIVLRLGRGMTGQMKAAWDRLEPEGRFHDLYQAEENAVLERVAELCEDPTRPLIVSAKNTDRLATLLETARGRGKRVIAIVSDLAIAARDAFVGVDNRAAGRTAAFLIGRMLGERPASVGVVLGDLAFRCHEDREIGFRTALRTHFPKITLSAEVQGEDSAEQTRAAVGRLLQNEPALGAIYNVGGGNAGLVEAVRDAGKARDLRIVCHEVNGVTAPLLKEGEVDHAIACDPALLLADALRLAGAERLALSRDEVLHDFGIYTRFNIPHFRA